MKHARKLLYGMITMGAVLLAACSHDDDVTRVVTPGEPVAIAFDCLTEPYENTRAANGYTGDINAENNELHYAGFGVFASTADGIMPDLMYNQEVEYVFHADGSGDGYWIYSPLKYWPADATDVSFCTYAPYVETPGVLPEGTTGIIGMSSTTATTPYIIYARAKHPEENVDLLWGYLKPGSRSIVGLTMHHALARVKLSLGITNGSTLAVGSRFLIKRIKLKGNFAKTGQLNLNHGATGAPPVWLPNWSAQVLADKDAADDEDNVIIIDHNPEVTPASYGIIDEKGRYLPGLPNRWQPVGLPHLDYDPSDPDLKDNRTNLLCMGDYPSYLYLIPQADLTFTCVLDYCIISADGSTLTDYHKTTATLETPIHITPLNGNKTYDVTLKVTI